MMRHLATLSIACGIFFAAPALAQDSQPPAAEACAASPAPERKGTAFDSTDRLELAARGLETAESVKALLLAPESQRAAQWCMEEDAVAHAGSMNHWRNIAAPAQSGAIVDRLMNFKGNTTIYVIRVAKGSSIINATTAPQTMANYAIVIDNLPDDLVVAGYFIGQPNTEELLGHMRVRARIAKADGATRINVPQ